MPVMSVLGVQEGHDYQVGQLLCSIKTSANVLFLLLDMITRWVTYLIKKRLYMITRRCNTSLIIALIVNVMFM